MQKRHMESGRSMVEMLGVLAVIGVLSIGGIAGYTLVYHSHGLQLVQHEPFQTKQRAIEEGKDIKSTTFLVENTSERMMVRDTDEGRALAKQITDLKRLLVAYRKGFIKEQGK